MDDPLVGEVKALGARVADLGHDVEVSTAIQKARLSQAVTAVRAGNRRRTLAILTVVGIVAGGGYSNSRAIAQNNRKLCPLVSIVIPRPGDPLPAAGPTGDRGRIVIANARAVQAAFGCPKLSGAPDEP